MRKFPINACAVAVLAAGWPATVAAAGTPEAVSMGQLGQVVLGLIAVLAVFGLCVVLLKRLPMVRTRQGGNLRVIEGLALGARDRVLLLQVEQTRLLIGVTPGRIECLHVMDEAPAFKAELAAAANAIHGASENSGAVTANRN
jgi:flagellar protein FliO/FliZ